jgi:hypothetical protein
MISVGCMRFDFQFFPPCGSTFIFDKNMNFFDITRDCKE